MSFSTEKLVSSREQVTKSDQEHASTQLKSTDKIRQRVEERHWQLFEARLKKQLPDVNKENYTHVNDYRIIDRLKKIDQPQSPVEPNLRWETFCHQVTNKSNETNRVMSIFHNVWLKNWSTKKTDEIEKPPGNDTKLNENTLLTQIPTNDNDRKIISTILHRTASCDRFSTNKE